MARPKRSTIPPKVQVPLAGMLIVLFGAILFWPSGKKREADVEAALLVNTDVSSAQIQRAELLSLIEQIEEASITLSDDDTTIDALSRDPFVPTAAIFPSLTGTSLAATRGGLDAPSEGRVVRKQFLADMTLSAVITMGNQAVAAVGEEYVRVGDELGGFTIREIHNDHIILEDELGTERLQIREPKGVGL